MSKNDSKKDNEFDNLSHEYDGIREYDYPAPNWWQIIFYVSIIWGIGYWVYYTLYDGETLRHRLDRELVTIQREKMKEASNGPSESDMSALLSNPAAIASGKEVFTGKCLSCHGDHGQGLIGPNLTDNFWIHGKGTLTDIYTVVDKGVADKGMPPWGPILSAAELKNVVAFVKSLQGTHPANPKAPQGEEIK